MRYFFIAMLLISTSVFGQHSTKEILKKLGTSPMFMVDSVIINHEQLMAINPVDIALLTVLYDTTAVKIFGNIAKDGAVLCETKTFARKHFITYFRKASLKYDSLYSVTKSDSSFQYIVNGKIASVNYEGAFESINDKTFISLELITADDLKNKYNITDKKYGILVNYSKSQPISN